MTPRRIQRRRTKGWRMPEGAVYVGRPGPWGNEFSAGIHMRVLASGVDVLVPDLATSLALHRAWLSGPFCEVDPSALRGKDLACWCGLCDEHRAGLPLGLVCADCPPCHADVLLELANG